MSDIKGVSQKVFLDRYSLKDKEGQPLEKEPSQMWKRVSKAVASLEKKEEQKKWEKEFYKAMVDFKYVPGGRILAGAGAGFGVTFYNCFVIPSPKDSRDGILDTLKQMVEIMARGGGVGINLSSLRQRGARVRKVNGFSSGPCNWAELFSVATKDIIQQGGCFTGDARIMTHKGLVKIEEIVKSKSNYFAATHKGFKKIITKFDNGIKEVFELETKGGYKVKVTGEHKFVAFDNNGSFYLKKLSDLKEEDNIVLLPAEFSNEIPEVILDNNLPKVSKFSYGRKDINLPKSLNSDLAFILGVYFSDGCRIKDKYTFAKGIRFAVDAKRRQDLKLLINTIKNLFGVKAKVRKGDGNVFSVDVHSRNLVEYLNLNGFLKENSSQVFVPEQIFTSPKQVVEAFIAGVFFGDGSNRGGKGGFRICSVNRKFLEDISLLLINLGIASKITKQTREKWQDLYTVSVNGNKFMSKFFNLVKKYNEKAYDNPISKRDGFFNFPQNILARFVYLSGIQRTMAYSNPTTSYKTISFIGDRIDQLKETDLKDVEILTSTVTDKIRKIKKIGQEQVFDLEVEDVHLLSGNGFYTSNSRRGALMIMLWDWHPDVEEFITVKQDLTKINGANLSVCVSDKFMDAVKNDADWELVFPDTSDPEYDEKWNGDLEVWKSLGKKVIVQKTVKARKIWDLVAQAAWKSAEPGVVFMERCNKLYNNWYWNRVNCVNPCGEEPLPEFGVCNLGSINLSALVKGSDIDRKGRFDFLTLKKIVKTAVRFQDNVVDMDPYVFEGIRKTQLEGERRIGLGTMGLGDTLIKLHLRYGSKESLKFIEKVYKIIRDEAYKMSVEIAKTKGTFPKFDQEKYPQGKFIQALPKPLREDIKKTGIRNSIILMQAPTGSTSLMSNTTSGIEPVFEFEFVRRDRLGEHIIRHHLYEDWYQKHEKEIKEGTKKVPEWFVSANDLLPEDHIRVQAVIQKYVDASISKTVNAPKTHTIEDVKKLYTQAYDLGCKGIAYMREGSRQGVLERVGTKKEDTVGEKKEDLKVKPIMKRPMVLHGVTYQTNTPLGDAFITINSDKDGNPFELFITIGRSGSDVAGMAEALGKTISLVLRLQSQVSPREKIRQVVAMLAGIGGGRTVGFGENKVRSLPDAVAKVLAEHFGFKVNGQIKDNQKPVNGEVKSIKLEGNGLVKEIPVMAKTTVLEQLSLQEDTPQTLFDLCPSCGSATLAHEEGCKKCYGCGYSEC